MDSVVSFAHLFLQAIRDVVSVLIRYKWNLWQPPCGATLFVSSPTPNPTPPPPAEVRLTDHSASSGAVDELPVC